MFFIRLKKIKEFFNIFLCYNFPFIFSQLPPLYVITPTYYRAQTLAELTRLGYTLKHVPNLVWLVVEDAPKPSPIVTKLLKKFNIPFEHMAGKCF